MKLSLLQRCVAVIGLLAFVATAYAHHSFRAQYDSTKPVTLQGFVTKVEWFNPHVYFYVDVENPDSGKIESWGVEMGPPHLLQNRGWKKNSMQIGDEVVVEATRARDGSFTANARTVKFAVSGEELGAASSEGDQTGLGSGR